jgi:hypothetical protein
VSVEATGYKIAQAQIHISGGGLTAVGSAGVSGAEGVAVVIPSSTVPETHWHDTENPPWIALAAVPMLLAVVYVAIRQRFGRYFLAPP